MAAAAPLLSRVTRGPFPPTSFPPVTNSVQGCGKDRGKSVSLFEDRPGRGEPGPPSVFTFNFSECNRKISLIPTAPGWYLPRCLDCIFMEPGYRDPSIVSADPKSIEIVLVGSAWTGPRKLSDCGNTPLQHSSVIRCILLRQLTGSYRQAGGEHTRDAFCLTQVHA